MQIIQKINKKILLLALLGVLVLPSIASAITIKSMVDAAVQTTLYIASGVIVILWIVTGMLFLTAQGDPTKLGSARKALFSAVAGTVLVIVAGGALGLVGSAFGI